MKTVFNPVLSDRTKPDAGWNAMINRTKSRAKVVFIYATLGSTRFLSSLSFAILGCDGSAKIISYHM